MSKSGFPNRYFEEKKSNDTWGRANKAIMRKRKYAWMRRHGKFGTTWKGECLFHLSVKD
jgi:hypothetical protein